jgi:hypothetical protein
MDTIRLPFAFRGGSFVTIPEDTDEYYANLIYCLTLTEAGEVVMRPNVGRGDIIFDSRQIQTLAYSVAEFIPEVNLDTFEAFFSDNGEVRIKMSFERN